MGKCKCGQTKRPPRCDESCKAKKRKWSRKPDRGQRAEAKDDAE